MTGPSSIGWLIAVAGVGFAITVLLTPLVEEIARRLRIVAIPGNERWHTRPVPLLGGISIYSSILLMTLLAVGLDPQVAAILAGTTIVFVLGFVDDLRPISPPVKLAVQSVAATLPIVFGLRLQVADHPVVWFPLTLLWIVGITNAFNLLDNIDGLAAGTGVITALVLATYGLLTSNDLLLVLSLLTAAASLGFLVRNFSPARIFMGDSGSLTLGFLLGGLCLMIPGTMTSGDLVLLIVLAAVMAVPLFDATLVTVLRLLNRRPITRGDRDHSSHRLVALGLSDHQAVMTLYMVSVVGGSLALASVFLDGRVIVILAVTFLLVTITFGVRLSRIPIYPLERLSE